MKNSPTSYGESLEVRGGKTCCRVAYVKGGKMFLTLYKEGIHSSICLGDIQGYMVQVNSDAKLFLQTFIGSEINTFFKVFPKTNFGPFGTDLLSDIGGVREHVKPRILELV